MADFTDISHARQLDREDNLSGFRKEFFHSSENLIYLDGNSLGRMPLRAAERLKEVLENEWGSRLIRSWSEGWLEMSKRLGSKIAGLIGAESDEVIMCDATSVNLFKLTLAAIRQQENRSLIISDELNFPSDLYILQGIVDLLGEPYTLEVLKPDNPFAPTPRSIRKALDENTALLSFTHTYFKSAFIQDMKTVTAMSHEAGALMLWDLSHSVGAVPVDLNACNADLAVGCTYKYLNGGPGSPAFLYVRRDLQDRLKQPIQGWLGSADPFEFGTEYQPEGGIGRFTVGTPPILSMAATEAGLNLHCKAGMKALRKKSIAQTTYLVKLFDAWLEPLGFELGSPRGPDQRGSHISIRHPEAARITEGLIAGDNDEVKVIPDFRQPDNIRLGIAPLYNSFEDILVGMGRIRELGEKFPAGL